VGGGEALAWGEGAVSRGELEEVWNDDPSAPSVEEEDSEELEEDDKGKLRVKKKRKRDAEHSWGDGQRVTLWWVLSGFVAILVVSFLLVQDGKSRLPSAPVEEPRRFVSELPDEDSQIVELLAMGQSAVAELVALIQQAEGPPEEAAKVMMRGPDSVARREAWRARVGLHAAVKDDGVIRLMAIHIGELDYLLVSGLRNDYTKYIAYIVEVDGELRLDWEATEGYCPLLPDEVMKMGEGEEFEMRVLASPSSFYTPIFPEDDFACVLLSHLDREHYAWGYVRRSSPEHDLLVGALSSPVTKMVADRVRIRVARGPEGALSRQVEVTAVLGVDWLEGATISEGEEDLEKSDQGE